MTDFDNVQGADCCKPSEPCDPPTTQNVCEGQITGVMTYECCCPLLYTRSFIVNIGPQSEGALIAYLQSTVSAYEAANFRVIAHSLIDTGSGWVLGLTIGWYA